MTMVGGTVLHPPDSLSAIREIADKLLVRAGVGRVFPTPVEPVLACAGVDELPESTASQLQVACRGVHDDGQALEHACRKFLGFTDLARRQVFAKSEMAPSDRRIVLLHETGHNVLPWHSVGAGYALSSACEDAFELEATLFAHEIAFQGSQFAALAGSMPPGFDAVQRLMQMYDVDARVVARRLVETSFEPLLLLSYRESICAVGGSLQLLLRLTPGASASQRFLADYSDTDVPTVLMQDHPWLEAHARGGIVVGELDTQMDGHAHTFDWQTSRSAAGLDVLLRGKARRPRTVVLYRAA